MARTPPVTGAEFFGSATHAKHYPTPRLPSIAFAGRSNVGKSSLINCLAERKRLAFTSNTPGRTQTINFYRMNQALYFVDLPGYGFARVPKSVKAQWGPMVEEYLASDYAPALVVLVLDLRRDLSDGDALLVDLIARYGGAILPVFTKYDTVKSSHRAHRVNALTAELHDAWDGWYGEPVTVSAKTRAGRDALWTVLLDAVQ